MQAYLKLLLFCVIFLLCECEVKCYYTNIKNIDWSDELSPSSSSSSPTGEIILSQHMPSAALTASTRGQFMGSEVDYYPTWSEPYLYLKPHRNIDEELRKLKAEPPRGLPNVMRYG
uniref:Spondin domain-containing protein n=1 Tax=Trichobilharzia regenti TaxID=157069 RepID=A0AA85K780_TRIRE|nr:unnamed protein product [Trichobilharzia regenti]